MWGFVQRQSVILLAVAILTGVEGFSGSFNGEGDSPWLIRTWETEDGLPENSATAMVQTPDGYLWFGTFNGLVRFDGVPFKVFSPANTPGLPDAGIVGLYCDKQNRLWASTFGGLALREGQTWRTVSKTSEYVRTFAERANGDLLLTMFEGTVHEA